MVTQEILSLCTLIATIVIGITGFACTIYQVIRANKVKKAEFVSKLLENIRLNKKVNSAIYIIDYSEEWYNEFFANSEDLEESIDALFSQIDFICYLYKNVLLTKKEFNIFKYEVQRICNSYQCRCYLWNLYHWSKVNRVDCSFCNLIDYLKSTFDSNQLFRFESQKEEISGYKKFLNF